MSVLASTVRLQDSIATQLLKVVFSIYFIITLTVTLVHMGAEYYNTKELLLQNLKQYQKTFEPGLTSAVWEVNRQQLQATIQGLIATPGILGVKVVDRHGRDLAALGQFIDATGKPVERQSLEPAHSLEPGLGAQLLAHSFSLTHLEADGFRDHLATVTFYSSHAVVFEQVRYGFMFIAINAVIKTLALWVIFVWAGRQMLSRPLAILSEATQELNLETLGQTAVNIRTRGRNELKVLEEAFNRMSEKLRHSKERLISLQHLTLRLMAKPELKAMLSELFGEVGKNLSYEAAFLLDVPGQRFLHYHEQGGETNVLRQPLSAQEWLQWLPEQQSLVLLNHLKREHPFAQFYQNYMGIPTTDSHWLLVRLQGAEDYLLGIYRSAKQEMFDPVEVEYIKSLVQVTQVTRGNIQTIQQKARMENELKTTAAVQRALFPKKLPELANLELASFFTSASETGGDWYGFMTEIENVFYIMIGDVTGHGTPAALVTATASATCKIVEEIYAQSDSPPSPGLLLQHLNKAVFEAGAPEFLMTFFIAKIDLRSGMMTFANAGHNFPLLRRANGKLQHLLNANTVLGQQEQWTFRQNQVQLSQGDQLLFFTDGLIESLNKQGSPWTERRMIHTWNQVADLPIREVVNRIVQEMYSFTEGMALEDDVTLVGCRIIQPFAV